MSRKHRKRKIRNGLSRVAKVFLALLAIVVVLGGFYAMSQFGPKRVNSGDLRYYTNDNSDLNSLRAEVKKRIDEIKQIEEIRRLRREDLYMVEEAIKLQNEVVRINFGGNIYDTQTQEDLRRKRDDIYGEALREEGITVEREASRLREAKQYAEALREYERALALQQSIHDDYPLSRYRDTSRLVNLRQSVADLNAMPLYERSVRAQQDANAAIENQRWDDARAYMERAVEYQRRVNNEHRGTRFSSIIRLKELEVEMSSIASGSLYYEVQTLVRKGDEMVKDGNREDASKLFDEARRLQARLNESYRDSRYASPEAIREIEMRRQTALSYDVYSTAAELDTQLNDLLKARRFDDAIALIGRVSGAVERLRSEYPLSAHLAELPTLKYSYLTYTRSNLPSVHDTIAQMTYQLPSGIRIATTEVTQELFQNIMGSNPSRVRGSLLPVESITPSEAEEFSMRLGWILGEEVDLPTQQHFVEALGDIRYQPLREMTWHRENSDDTIHPVKSSRPSAEGLYDLLGNVAELVRRTNALAGESEFIAMGGSYLTPLEQIVEIPIEPVDSNQRSRFVGFRFVILDEN